MVAQELLARVATLCLGLWKGTECVLQNASDTKQALAPDSTRALAGKSATVVSITMQGSRASTAVVDKCSSCDSASDAAAGA
jgi:hypothetical protein